VVNPVFPALKFPFTADWLPLDSMFSATELAGEVT
jgi:hypothetical protein